MHLRAPRLLVALAAVATASALNAQAPPAGRVPDVTLSHTPLLAEPCERLTGKRTDAAAERELVARLPEFRARWAVDGPPLLRAAVEVAGQPFRFRETIAALHTCTAFSNWSIPLSLSMRRYLRTPPAGEAADSLGRFTAVLFHEVLHRYVVDALGLEPATPLWTKYATESPRVRWHLHLLAIEDSAYRRLGLVRELASLRAEYQRYPSYARARSIVDAEGPRAFLAELRASRVPAPAPTATSDARSRAAAGASPASDTAPSVRWKALALAIVREVSSELVAARRSAAAGDSSALHRLRRELGVPGALGRMAAVVNAAAYAAADSAARDVRRPSPRAAMAGAAAQVLAAYVPRRAGGVGAVVERELAAARRDGASPAQIADGDRLGRDVAAAALEWAKGDRSEVRWTGPAPTGPGVWWGTPGIDSGDAGQGLRRPWLLRSAAQLRPPRPPAYGSPAFTAALEEVRRVARARTPEQTRIAQRWARASALTLWGDIAVDVLVRHAVPEPRAARVLGVLSAAVADAGIACWEAKYHYWLLRPTQADSAIALADSLGVPNFPAYPSGHACGAGATAEVVSHFVPEARGELTRMADEAAMSRLYAGVHYRFDNDAGLALGHAVARWAIAADARGALTRSAPWRRARPRAVAAVRR